MATPADSDLPRVQRPESPAATTWDDANVFLKYAVDAILSNWAEPFRFIVPTLPLPQRMTPFDRASEAGQIAGDLAALIWGGVEMVKGVGIATVSVKGGAALSVFGFVVPGVVAGGLGVVAGGAIFAHGAGMTMVAANRLMERAYQNKNQGQGQGGGAGGKAGKGPTGAPEPAEPRLPKRGTPERAESKLRAGRESEPRRRGSWRVSGLAARVAASGPMPSSHRSGRRAGSQAMRGGIMTRRLPTGRTWRPTGMLFVPYVVESPATSTRMEETGGIERLAS